MDNFHLFQIPTDLELFNWNDKSPEVSGGGVAGTAGTPGDMANLTKESQQAPSHSAKPAKETQQNTR